MRWLRLAAPFGLLLLPSFVAYPQAAPAVAGPIPGQPALNSLLNYVPPEVETVIVSNAFTLPPRDRMNRLMDEDNIQSTLLVMTLLPALQYSSETAADLISRLGGKRVNSALLAAWDFRVPPANGRGARVGYFTYDAVLLWRFSSSIQHEYGAWLKKWNTNSANRPAPSPMFDIDHLLKMTVSLPEPDLLFFGVSQGAPLFPVKKSFPAESGVVPLIAKVPTSGKFWAVRRFPDPASAADLTSPKHPGQIVGYHDSQAMGVAAWPAGDRRHLLVRYWSKSAKGCRDFAGSWRDDKHAAVVRIAEDEATLRFRLAIQDRDEREEELAGVQALFGFAVIV
jgi:hypothetical protein